MAGFSQGFSDVYGSSASLCFLPTLGWRSCRRRAGYGIRRAKPSRRFLQVERDRDAVTPSSLTVVGELRRSRFGLRTAEAVATAMSMDQRAVLGECLLAGQIVPGRLLLHIPRSRCSTRQGVGGAATAIAALARGVYTISCRRIRTKTVLHCKQPLDACLVVASLDQHGRIPARRTATASYRLLLAAPRREGGGFRLKRDIRFRGPRCSWPVAFAPCDSNSKTRVWAALLPVSAFIFGLVRHHLSSLHHHTIISIY